VSVQDDDKKLIVFEKGKLLFIFNFHSTRSYENQAIGTKWSSEHFIVIDSDDERFGGHRRLDKAHGIWFPASN